MKTTFREIKGTKPTTKLNIIGVANNTTWNKDIAFYNKQDIKTRKELKKFIEDNFTIIGNQELSFSREYDYSFMTKYLLQDNVEYHMRVIKYFDTRTYYIDILKYTKPKIEPKERVEI